jgi:hypothetical protein
MDTETGPMLAGLLTRPNGGGPTSPEAAPSQPTEEDLLALLQSLGLGTIPERNALLEQQMAQAHAVRQGGRAERRTSPMGAILGGLGDVAGALGGTLQENDATQQMLGNFGKQDQGRAAAGQLDQLEYQRALAEALRKGQ